MSLQEHNNERRIHWDAVADIPQGRRRWGRSYQSRLLQVYRQMTGTSHRTLEIGCGKCDLLAAQESQFSVGVDLSLRMLKEAAGRHPDVHLVQADCS